MSEFITLSRAQSGFESYLDGSFSSERRAIAVKTLNANTQAESVTFEIFDSKQLNLPTNWRVWLTAFRLNRLVQVLVPLVLVLFYFESIQHLWSGWMALTASLGVSFIQIGVSLLNDYYDHMKGVDRLHSDTGSRVIQRGWLPAWKLKRVGKLFLITGMLFGLPSVIWHPGVLVFLGLIVLIATWEYSSDRLGFKYRGFGEVITFFLLGPLLTCGFSWAISGWTNLVLFLQGIALGWLTVTVMHAKNVENLFVDSQAGFKNLMTWIGFDRIRVFMELWLIGFWLWLSLYSWVTSRWLYFFLLGFVFLFLAWRLMRVLKKSKSSLSSSLNEVSRHAVALYVYVVGLWIIIDLAIIIL